MVISAASLYTQMRMILSEKRGRNLEMNQSIVRRTMLFGAAALIALALSGCGNNKEAAPAEQVAQNNQTETNQNNTETNEAAGEPREIEDELGNKITIPAQASSVYAPGLEDYLVALGVTPVAQWSTGLSPQQYLQDTLAGVHEISFANGVPSPESIIDLKPDLILFPTAYYAQNGVYENYTQIAPTYVFQNALGDAEQSTLTIAGLLGLEDKAEEVITAYHASMQQAKDKLAAISEGKQAVLINANAKAIFLVGNSHYGGYVLSQLGFAQNALVEGQASAELSLEMLPDLDADYIFINDNDGLGEAFLTELKSSPLWNTIPAVAAGQVYEVKGDHWRSSGLIAYEKTAADIEGFLLP